ncbi:type II toxin-antitoxin system VapC family toxin [Desulfovirgula thermocuniculi]|uniref:type II toxin-antitoxin system VapC family toxin n=1 Tax=Desulfovirgula thermocuniculi TaxID=348842 RepID=UPI0006873F85|nr:type II toxin-antitoxin system VapC family toxin [Desulfovirgula thermocuniculi]
MRIVVDASVSLKWVFDDEEHVEEAVALRDSAVFERSFEMFAPSLWVYEVANGLLVAVRRGRILMDVSEEALRHLLALGVRVADPEPADVYRCAFRYRISAYDAAYLALAEELDAVLFTGDGRFYTAVRELVPRVRWIGEFGKGKP